MSVVDERLYKTNFVDFSFNIALFLFFNFETVFTGLSFKNPSPSASFTEIQNNQAFYWMSVTMFFNECTWCALTKHNITSKCFPVYLPYASKEVTPLSSCLISW